MKHTDIMRASHRGIPYELLQIADGEWRWAFTPPTGPARSGRVRGGYRFAVTVAQRGVEVWSLMNRPPREEAA